MGTADIFTAVAAGDVDSVRQLIAADADVVNARGEHDVTPLIVAAREGHKPVAELLVGSGADIEAKDSEHTSTPLIWAVFFGHPVVADVLLREGADVNARNGYGSTSLTIALEGTQGKWQETNVSAERYNELADLLRNHGGVA